VSIKIADRKNLLYLGLISLFFILIVISNLNWLALDKSIPIDDHANHIYRSYKFFHSLKKGDMGGFFLNTAYFYPTFTYQLSSFFYMAFGTGEDMAAISQVIFWGILIFSIFFIGRRLWGPEAGLLAGIAAFSFPYINAMSQGYLLDIPCAAMVSLAVLMILLSDAFQKPQWTIAFFAVMACAMLTKWSAAFFVFPVFIYFFVLFLIDLFKEKKSPWLTLGSLLITVAAVVFGIVYLQKKLATDIVIGFNAPGIYIKSIAPLVFLFIISFFLPFKAKASKRFVQGVILFFILIWHFYALGFKLLVRYYQTVVSCGIIEGDTFSPLKFLEIFTLDVQGIPGVVFILPGLIWYFFSKDKTRDRNILPVGFLGSLLILFLIQDKDPRYFLPIITFSSVLMTYWITLIKLKPVKILAIIVFILVGPLPGIAGWRIPIYSNFARGIYYSRPYYHPIIAAAPKTGDWKLDEISKILVEYMENEPTMVLLTYDGTATTKTSPNFLAMALTADKERLVLIPSSIHLKETEAFLPDKQQRYKFFLVVPRQDMDHIFKKIVVMYFKDNSLNNESVISHDKILRVRGYVDKPGKKKSINLPNNIVLEFYTRKMYPEESQDDIERGR